jgi:hypothetical protein
MHHHWNNRWQLDSTNTRTKKSLPVLRRLLPNQKVSDGASFSRFFLKGCGPCVFHDFVQGKHRSQMAA